MAADANGKRDGRPRETRSHSPKASPVGSAPKASAAARGGRVCAAQTQGLSGTPTAQGEPDQRALTPTSRAARRPAAAKARQGIAPTKGFVSLARWFRASGRLRLCSTTQQQPCL